MQAMEPKEILDFWLEEVGPNRWYDTDEALDTRTRERFENAWRSAMEGAYESWMVSPKGALALLILLDQFPRNMFRATAGAYSSDSKALALAKRALDMGHDARLAEPERQFFYLPLMHSECLSDQERCVRLIACRMPETGEQNLPHAVRHREVIRRFGRFPGRNGPLGRNDTPPERAYRDEGGYMA